MRFNLFEFISLHYGEEKREKVIENITSSISFRGSNIWILACAIVIASVGLNVNSTAVIIGAMLISPLMGPIVGMGFSLAVYDFELLKKSSKNLVIATLVSLLVATIYFIISPFKETQSELLARTAPNIYDVLIAFFGGLAGIIALTRVEKGNPIPGVAIATALMPPLCTAGYGLAIGNYSYFFGAFYLYAINCVFIGIATFIIVKYLKYETVKSLNVKSEKLIRNLISIVVTVMVIPSVYLAYNLYQEKSYSDKINLFISNEFDSKGYTLIYKEVNQHSNPKKIELAFLSKLFDASEIENLNIKLKQYGINNSVILIKQDTLNVENNTINKLSQQNRILINKDQIIQNLQKELKEKNPDYSEILHEITILFPELTDITLGEHQSITDNTTTQPILVLTYRTNKKDVHKDLEKLEQWLKQKVKIENIEILKKD